MAHTTSVEISDEFSILICRKPDSQANRPRTNVVNVFVIDNSGSMGYMTRQCADTFSKIYDLTKNGNINMMPGMLILFSEYAKVYSNTITSSNDVQKVSFPYQGQTNITAGIDCAITSIINHKKLSGNADIHYIITFLSDGGHNNGLRFDKYSLNALRSKIDEAKIKLSLIVVGIVNSDTTLGMSIKTSLETVHMPHLDSVYYARSGYEFQPTLQKVLEGFTKSLDDCLTIKLKLENAVFINESMSTETTCFLSSGSSQNYLVVRRTDKSRDYAVYINDEKVNTETHVKQLSNEDITNVIDALCPKLSQKNIASGVNSIKEQVQLLQSLIDTAEIFFANLLKVQEVGATADDIGKIHIKPSDRLKMIKKMKTTQHTFALERNKLKALIVTVENNSAKQAEYLTGINKKYATKAINRTDMTDVSLVDVFNDVNKTAGEIEKIKGPEIEHNNDLSLLSLNTPQEEYDEWLSIKERKLDDFDNVYAFLAFCGYSGYPVKFQHNNAVQMDPFQTSCLDIEPCMIDSPSIMLANQLNYNNIKSPSGKPITDVLVLVSPSCPEQSLLAMRSILYKYHCSITLCRDLYMFHPRMSFSLHAHSLLTCINSYCETGSTAYLNLGINIVYSAYKLGIGRSDTQKALFARWFDEGATLTQSDADNCNHPVQLPLLLAVNSLPIKLEDPHDTYMPLINLLNEAMARTMRVKLASNPAVTATGFAQRLLGIDSQNSPKPDMENLLSHEPPLEDVRNTCTNIPYNVYNSAVMSDLHIKNSTIIDYVDTSLRPYLRTFHFCYLIQKFLQESSKTWKDLSKDIESFNEELSNYMRDKMAQIKDTTVYKYLNVTDNKKVQLASMNMFLQGTLHTDSGSRADILDYNVFDASTFRKMSVDLMMAFYEEACKVKREKYMEIIGDVTLGSALSASNEEYDAMLGVHTHGFCKNKFWALLRASKGNEKKRKLFFDKSNSTVSRCLRKTA